MAEARDLTLSPDDVQLALATGDAMKAAGGQVAVEAATGRAQSRLSDYCSRNTASFIPINLAARVDELRIDAKREPYILAAYAARLGYRLLPRPQIPACAVAWHEALADICREAGDVINAIGTAAADGEVKGREPRHIRRQIAELQTALAHADALAEAAERQ